MGDWYKVTGKRFLELEGGPSFLKRHKGSLSTALMEMYPEHNWEPWRFEKVPANWFREAPNARRFLEFIRAEQGWNDISELNQLTAKLVLKHGGRSYLRRWLSISPG